MTLRYGLFPLLFLALATNTSGQTPARAPGGTLRGVVRDSASGEPIGYALVVLLGTEQQAFTSASGRFSLTGLGAGKVVIRVQQIGYRPQTLNLAINVRLGESAPALSVLLSRHSVVLPEISVAGKSCLDLRELGTSAEPGELIAVAFANAERILAMERKYPFVLEFQRVITRLDSGYNLTGGVVDTIQRDSRGYLPYRTGKVLQKEFGKESLSAFTSSDFAGDEFQRAHCFWYAGRDSVGGKSGYRIDFTPKPEVTTPDWAGSMLVDSVSLGLLRTETHLVNLPQKGTSYLRASCTIFYQPIVPNLPQEFQTKCLTTPRGSPPKLMVERWSLINRRFLGKTPMEPDPPR